MSIDLPIYEPGRDHRFEYGTDAIQWMEDNWCRRGPEGCRHADVHDEFPSSSCPLHLMRWLAYKQVPQVRDAGNDGLVCLSYVDSRQQDGPDLFEEES